MARKQKYSLEQIAELYNQNLSGYQIAEHLGGINPRTISYHIRKAEKAGLIQKRTLSEALTVRQERKYELDEDFFKKIDTEPKAYVLGFLYADGYNNEKRGRIEINISASDVDILEKISAAIKSTKPLRDLKAYTSEKIKGSGPKKRLSIEHRFVSQDLAKLGCYQGKSLTCRFPTSEQVPPELISHFVRGYFDGDGWIYRSVHSGDLSMGYCGSYDFISALASFLNEKFDWEKKIYPSSKIFRIDFNGINHTKTLYEWMYKDATIWLNRKKREFDEGFVWYYSDSNVTPRRREEIKFKSANRISKNRPVLQYDLSMNLIKEHPGASHAARDTGVLRDSIMKACNNNKRQAGGFNWRWKWERPANSNMRRASRKAEA